MTNTDELAGGTGRCRTAGEYISDALTRLQNDLLREYGHVAASTGCPYCNMLFQIEQIRQKAARQ